MSVIYEHISFVALSFLSLFLFLSLTISPFLCARLPLYRNFHSGFVLLSDPNESMTISVRNVINLTTFQHFPHVICRIKSIWNWALAKQVTRTLYSSQPIEYSILLWNTCQNMAHFLKVYWEFHIYMYICMCACGFSGFQMFASSYLHVLWCECFKDPVEMCVGSIIGRRR